jgi:hypothetical protein
MGILAAAQAVRGFQAAVARRAHTGAVPIAVQTPHSAYKSSPVSLCFCLGKRGSIVLGEEGIQQF